MEPLELLSAVAVVLPGLIGGLKPTPPFSFAPFLPPALVQRAE